MRNQIFSCYTSTGEDLLNQPEISNKKIIRTKV